MAKPSKPAQPGAKRRSAGSGTSQDLSEFEFGLIVTGNGFMRWVERCMAAAGENGLNYQDALVLHAVNHRARGKRLSEICMVMNLEDPHIVAYALKKLVARGLVQIQRQGREKHYASTRPGDALCQRYRRVRELHLVKSLAWIGGGHNAILDAASFLRAMSALYEQAARLATVANAPVPAAPE
ncbi:MAG: winged helix DNA-binding protein [Proteobacteria bacterium]|nr:winged helix DNA-binding protein [Pseudomonadota bacterium]MBI3498201.1 winged helix DNA-binding protein [Pseudomonadota bacterium]